MRNESVKNIMRSKHIVEEDKAFLSAQLNNQMMMNWGNKAMLFGSLFLLYKRGFFNTASKLMVKEVSLVCGGVAENYFAETYINEYFWSNVKGVVRKYALIKEREFLELKQNSERMAEEGSDDLYN